MTISMMIASMMMQGFWAGLDPPTIPTIKSSKKLGKMVLL
jgi:hypothetical protein